MIKIEMKEIMSAFNIRSLFQLSFSKNVLKNDKKKHEDTRIRKKHYIEALKESLKLLSEERDKIDRDRRNSLSRLAEQVIILIYW